MSDKEALEKVEKYLACRNETVKRCHGYPTCLGCPHYVSPRETDAAMAVAAQALREKVEAEGTAAPTYPDLVDEDGRELPGGDRP